MHLRGQLHRSFASLRMTAWIYATNLWDATPDPALKMSNLRTLARQLMALHLLAVPHFLLPFLHLLLKILQLLI